MANTKFNAGDLVELKSGGPVMTIERVAISHSGGDISYACTWFAGSKENHKVFTEASLEVAEVD